MITEILFHPSLPPNFYNSNMPQPTQKFKIIKLGYPVSSSFSIFTSISVYWRSADRAS